MSKKTSKQFLSVLDDSQDRLFIEKDEEDFGGQHHLPSYQKQYVFLNNQVDPNEE